MYDYLDAKITKIMLKINPAKKIHAGKVNRPKLHSCMFMCGVSIQMLAVASV